MQLPDKTWVVVDTKAVRSKAPGGFSAHNYGLATDWGYFKGDEYVVDIKSIPYHEYRIAVKRAGLTWGGDWNNNGKPDIGDYDYPHNQMPLRVPYSAVGKVRLEKGEEEARKFIERNLVI